MLLWRNAHFCAHGEYSNNISSLHLGDFLIADYPVRLVARALSELHVLAEEERNTPKCGKTDQGVDYTADYIG